MTTRRHGSVGDAGPAQTPFREPETPVLAATSRW